MLLTIDNAGRVLDLFTTDVHERGVTEVALELGVSKSKAHALLSSLARVGLLRRTPTSRYRLGWRVLRMNRALDESTDFRDAARPVMRVVHERFGETVHLGTLDDGRVIYVDRRIGRAGSSHPSAVGMLVPAHATALGKVLLASLRPAALSDVLERRGLAACTPNTITDATRLVEELESVRLRGFATEREESVPGLACVAAPIVATGPHIVAAVSMTVPTERFDAHALTFQRAVVLAAHHISRALREPGRSSAPAGRVLDLAAA